MVVLMVMSIVVAVVMAIMVVPFVIVVRMTFFGVFVLYVIHITNGACAWLFTTRPRAIHRANVSRGVLLALLLRAIAMIVAMASTSCKQGT